MKSFAIEFAASVTPSSDVERVLKICAYCGKQHPFNFFRPHSARCKFCVSECSRARRESKGVHRECGQCASLFLALAGRAGDGYAKFCSATCANNAKRTSPRIACPRCGGEVRAKMKRDRGKRVQFCSATCRNAFHIGVNSPLWKGGRASDGTLMAYAPRPDRVNTSFALHRLVAERSIGRLLIRGETVIRINGVPDDVSPSNLFICSTFTEFLLRFNRKRLPWPTTSNLETYR